MKTEQREAGPALNAEIETRVMGKCLHVELIERSAENSGEGDWWLECVACGVTGVYREDFEPGQYSASISGAFLVVEAMRAKGWICAMSVGDEAWAGFRRPVHSMSRHRATASTLALAICLAALKTLDPSPSSSAVDTPSSAVSQEDTR